MQDTLWSSRLQGILNLDLSRELRFRDDRKELILNLLRLRPGMSVVDIGCGPGALTRKLAGWLGPTSRVTGVDRDTAFIEYARHRAQEHGMQNIQFKEGDALSLPLEDNSVDACTSHTVIEHVPNSEFLLEQKRVCCSEGIASVMISLGSKGITSSPDSAPQMSNREKELWKPIEEAFKEEDERHITRTHWLGFDGLPRLFHELGFREIQVDAVSLPVVPGDSRNRIEQKQAIIEAEKQQALESLEMGSKLIPGQISQQHAGELRACIEDRFGERLSMVERGILIWDYRIFTVLIVSGIV